MGSLRPRTGVLMLLGLALVSEALSVLVVVVLPAARHPRSFQDGEQVGPKGRGAVDFTLAHPERVRSLALLAPPWPGYPWSADMVAYDEAETEALASGDLDTAVRINLDMWLRGPARGWEDVPAGPAGRLRDPMRTSLANRDIVAEHSQGAAQGDVSALPVPTLVGIGKLDVADFQDIARRYASEIPGATLAEFDTAAHLIALDAPTELLAVLSPFLAR